MPTDVLIVIDQKNAIEKGKAADLLAFLIWIPLIMCLLSILLRVEPNALKARLTAICFE